MYEFNGVAYKTLNTINHHNCKKYTMINTFHKSVEVGLTKLKKNIYN